MPSTLVINFSFFFFLLFFFSYLPPQPSDVIPFQIDYFIFGEAQLWGLNHCTLAALQNAPRSF